MKKASLFVVSVCLSFGLVGCFDGSSSSSDRSSEGGSVEFPGEIELIAPPSDGDDATVVESFDNRRFFIQETDSGASGLYATSPPFNSPADSVDSAPLLDRQFFTVLKNDNGRQVPAGVFYRTSDEFRYAPTDGLEGDDYRTLFQQEDLGAACIGNILLNPLEVTQTAIAYNLDRDSEGNCPSVMAEAAWSQILIGEDGEASPTNFPGSHAPVIPLTGVDEQKPAWLIYASGGEEARGVFFAEIDNLDETRPVPIHLDGRPADEDHDLNALSLLAYLDEDSVVVSFRIQGEDRFRLGHFDRSSEAITELTEADASIFSDLYPFDSLPRPAASTTRDGVAYTAFANILLAIDSEQFRVLDTIEVGKQFANRFIISADTHLIWSTVVLGEEDDLSDEIRIVELSSGDAFIFPRVPYSESYIRGSVNNRAYFTVGRGPTDDGRLASPFAVAIDFNALNGFSIEGARWIGASVIPGERDILHRPDQATISEIFLRRGSDQRQIAFMDGANPQSLVSLNALKAGETGAFLGPGFGPQRLLTAVSLSGAELEPEDELEGGELGERSLSARVYRLDPDNGTMTEVSTGSGSLTRALPLF